MIRLRIGDMIEIDGKELEVWSFKCTTSAKAMTGQLELVDPMQASRWRETQVAEDARVALLSDGKMTRVVNKVEQALD